MRMKLTFLNKGSILLLAFCSLTGCAETEKEDELSGSISEEIRYANQFGKDIMSTYYLWNTEISDDLDAWNIKTNEDPIGTVDRIRYHDGEQYIDKWTMLTDDMESFTSSMEGVSTTFGWNLTVYRLAANSNQCIGVVNFVYDNTPASRMNLKRGDIIIGLNGGSLTTENYLDLYYSPSLTVSLGKLDVESYQLVDLGKKVSLTAETLYEDPVLCDSIYEFNGKKVGYLAYSSFDLKSIDKLIEIAKHFKQEQVGELILDLRYNSGGYVITENVLASMFAPQEDVSQKKVFEKEVYNDLLTQAGWGEETPFTTEFYYPEVGVNANTQDANIGLTKIYGLIGSGSASASEALLGGLMPYMEVELIGGQSHGKYCTGYLLSPEDVYEDSPQDIKNWGIYVMVSIYQNAAGKTPCMPDGLIPDVEVADNAMLPYQLGDVDEPLLRAALTAAGRTYDDEGTLSTRSLDARFIPMRGVQKPVFGKRILLAPSAKFRPLGRSVLE